MQEYSGSVRNTWRISVQTVVLVAVFVFTPFFTHAADHDDSGFFTHVACGVRAFFGFQCAPAEGPRTETPRADLASETPQTQSEVETSDPEPELEPRQLEENGVPQPSAQPLAGHTETHANSIDPTITNLLHISGATLDMIEKLIKRSDHNAAGLADRDSGSFIDTSEFVTKDLFYAQNESTRESSGDRTAALSESLAEAIETGALTVTGNTILSALTATTLGIGTTTLQDTLTLDGALYLANTIPGDTTSRLYNSSGNLYWNGSLVGGSSVGTWDTNGSDVYRVSGNVGIGTSSPQTSLHIDAVDGLVLPAGTTGERPGAPYTGTIRYNTTASQFEGYSGSNWSGLGGVIDVDQDTKILAESSSGADEDTLFLYTDGSERMRITNTGNVGIGTTSPSRKLTVQGSALISDTLTLGTLAATSSVSAPYFTATDANATSTFAGNISLGESKSYRIDGTPLLGMGSATSSFFVGVGNISSAENASAVGYNNTASYPNASVFGWGNSVTSGASDKRSAAFGAQNSVTGTNSSAFGLKNSAPGGSASAFGYSNSASGNWPSAFGYNNTVTSARGSAFGYSNIASSNAAAFGFSNDASGSSAAFGLSNTADGNAAAFGISNTASANPSFAFGYNNTATAINTTVFGQGITNNLASSTMIGPGDDSKLTILGTTDHKGFVGIGTTSPWAKLSITGSGLATGKAFAVANASNTPQFIIQDNGNVGIGETSPNADLEITPSGTSPFTINNASGLGILTFAIDGGAGRMQVNDSSGTITHRITGKENGHTYFNIGNAPGNFGIRTSSPSSDLTVAGEARVTTRTTAATFDIASASLAQSIGTQDGGPQDIMWNNDGTKIYEIGNNNDLIYEYSVSTPYDISTATFSQSISTQDSNPTGFSWNNDGTKLYEVGAGSSLIYEYNVSTPYDISTATFSQSISAQDGTPSGITWNNDGTKLYEVGAGSSLIYEYNVSTPYDISTASFSQSISTQDTSPGGIAWNSDGTKLYEIGRASDLIYEYNVSTPYDISTASFLQSISTQGVNPTGFAWNADGSKLYETGFSSDKIYEYSLSSGTTGGDLIVDNQTGIGTTTMLSQLDVVSGSNTRTPLTIAGFSAAHTADLFNIKQYATATPSFVVDANGNVGIGTTSPYAKLSVVGETVSEYFTATSMTATSTFKGGLNVGASNEYLIYNNGATAIDTSDGTKIRELFVNNETYSDLWRAGSPTNIDNMAGEIQYWGQEKLGSWRLDLGCGNNCHGNTGASLSHREEGVIYAHGIGEGEAARVAIGSTANPTARFEVISKETDVPTLTIEGAGSQTSDLFQWKDSSNTLGVIDSSGNVGIGETSPNADLEITPSGTSPLTINNASGETRGTFAIDGSGAGRLQIYDLNTTISHRLSANINEPTYFNVGSAENVGIKTTSPSSDFTVAGDTRVTTRSTSATFDISNASFSQSISTQDSEPRGITWNNDGSKLYEVGLNSDLIYEYTVSTPYDISTASFSQSISTQDSTPFGITWNNDGSKLYEVGVGSNSIYEYTVSTPYDISTASFSQSISTQDSTPVSITWDNDGSKLYEVGYASNLIYEYDVATPYDISTASFSQSISTQDGQPRGITWNNDGTKLYEVGRSSNLIYEYNVSTPYDISTASFSQSIATQDSISNGIAWNNDGSKLYEVGSLGDKIYEYTLSSGTTGGDLIVDNQTGIGTTTLLSQLDVVSGSNTRTPLTIAGFSSGQTADLFNVKPYATGTSSFIIDSSGNVGIGTTDPAYPLTVAGGEDTLASFENDVGSARFSFANTNDNAALNLTNADNTTKAFLDTNGDSYFNGGALGVGLTNPSELLHVSGGDAYIASTAGSGWGLSTASSDGVIFDPSEVGGLRDITFKGDGTKLYVVGNTSDTVYQYSLPTAWDVNTVTYDSISYDISGQATYPEIITFKSDGTRMYILDRDTDVVHQYSLSTPWDLSTVSYSSVSFDAPGHAGLEFKSDGTAMYIIGNNTVYQYSLSEAWNVSTASDSGLSFDLSSQSGSAQDIEFKSDGTRMYTVTYSGGIVYQYSLSEAWDVSSASYSDTSFNGSNSVGLEFKPDGTKMFNGKIEQYTLSGSADGGRLFADRSIGIGDTVPDFGLEIAASTTNGYFGISSLDSNDGDLFTVDGNGNVGVGTTSPSSKLTVAGNALVTGDLTLSTLTATSSISAPYFTATGTNATSTFAGGVKIFRPGENQGNQTKTLLELAVNDQSFDLKPGSGPAIDFRVPFTNSEKSKTGARIAARRTSSGETDESSRLAFSTSDGNTLSERFGISPSGFWGGGNAVSSPSVEIDYIQSNDARFFVNLGSNGDTANIGISGDMDGSNGGRDAWMTFILDESTGTAKYWSIGPDDSDSDSFKISNASALGSEDRLTLTTSGNVGIGTTSPNAKLTIEQGLGGSGDLFRIASSSDGTATTTHFMVDAFGRVGIGTTTPSHTLTVGGSAAFTGLSNDSTGYYACVDTNTGELSTSTSACGASSERFKENIIDIAYGLETVNALRPVSFEWKDEHIANGTPQIGFIAEEVASTVPEVVGRNADGKVTNVDYPKLTAVLAAAIKELAGMVTDIKDTIAGFAERFVTKEVVTDRLCIADENGGTTCLTRSEVDGLLERTDTQPAEGSDETENTEATGGDEEDAGTGASTEETATTTGGNTGTSTGTTTNPVSADGSQSEPTTNGTSTTEENTDITPPEITLEGDAEIELTEGDPYTEPGYTASDDTDGEITSDVVVGGDTVDTTTPGTYTVTYNVTDAAGNDATEQTRTVTVLEPEQPADDNTEQESVEADESTETATSTTSD